MIENIDDHRQKFNERVMELLRRFGLLRVESGNNMVEKLVKPGTNLRFVPFEDLFDIIHDSHIEKGHPGRDIMQKYLATKFANVTTDHVNTYRIFCEKCGLKKAKARRGVVVKPILTQNVMSRGQVGSKDLPRPLKFRTTSTVSEMLVEICSQMGPTTILFTLA